jgi:predicted transposase/invertase (TIGR01784 family)
MDAGDKYSSLKPAIGIHFLDYKMYPKQTEYQFCFEFKDCRHPKLELTQDLALHLFELPKIKRIYVNRKGQADDMIQWLHFFNNAHKEDETMREHYTNPAIHKAFTFLEELSADEIERQRAEIREKALKDEATFLDDAKKEGFAEGIEQGADAKARSMVQILLAMKVASSEQIAEITGLSLEKIEAMQASLA